MLLVNEIVAEFQSTLNKKLQNIRLERCVYVEIYQREKTIKYDFHNSLRTLTTLQMLAIATLQICSHIMSSYHSIQKHKR